MASLASRLGPRSLVAAGAVLVGVGLILVGTSLAAGGPVAVSRNAPVDPAAASQLDISANNSPAVARNPVDGLDVAVVNRVDQPSYSCALHVSRDGGKSWSAVAIPFPEGEEAPPRCFAPDVSFGPTGTMYVSFVTLAGSGNVPHAAWLVSSRDGRTLSVPHRLLRDFAFQVGIAADPSRPERLYLAWLQASGVGLYSFPNDGAPIFVSRSDDDGATWSPGVAIAPATRQRIVAPSIAVTGDGHLTVSYLDLGGDLLDYRGLHLGRGGPAYNGTWQLVVARSGDAGETWRETVADDHLVPVERFIVFEPPTPALAVDGTNVYVAFHDSRLGDPDVWLWASHDSGVTFRPPVRVNDNAVRDGTAQYLPTIGVAGDGRLDVMYYDRRADRQDVLNEVSMQSSSNHGTTFGSRVRVSDRSFNSRESPSSFRGMYDLGSRLGLLSTTNRTLGIWSDTRAALPDTGKQSLASAVVVFPRMGALRGPLRWGGLAVVVAAALLFVAFRKWFLDAQPAAD